MSCTTTFPINNVPNGVWPNIVGAAVQIPYPGISNNARAQNRFLLRDAWNSKKYKKYEPKMGNFRLYNNAGDYLSRVNYACGGPNPLGPAPPYSGDSMSRQCDNTGVAAASCNVSYVYDSSNYTEFKKLSAINRGYNGGPKGKWRNYSAGGDNYNAAQVTFRRKF